MYTIRLTNCISKLNKVSKDDMTVIALWETTNVYRFKAYLQARFYAHRLQDCNNKLFDFPAVNMIIRDIDAIHTWFPHNTTNNVTNNVTNNIINNIMPNITPNTTNHKSDATKSDVNAKKTLLRPELQVELLGYLRARVRMLNVEIMAQKRALATDMKTVVAANKPGRVTNNSHQRLLLSHDLVKAKYPEVYKECLQTKAFRPLIVK